jgi:uncharacterized protein YqgC (DUF456 family)
MDWLLLSLAIIFLAVGLIGCILPVLPGPPLSFIGMLVLHSSRFANFETKTLVIFGALALIVQILDYIVPVLGTKQFGGSKYGSWGSIIGLIVGLFFVPAIGPFGIITILGGPFLGAYIGEKIGGKENKVALKAAIGSFIGFLTGTFLKLVTSIAIIIACFVAK